MDLFAGPEVDYVGDCQNLAQFEANSIEAVYASHVLEHVPYTDIQATLKEWHRVLMPRGKFMVAVPCPAFRHTRGERCRQSFCHANDVRRSARRYRFPLHRLRSGNPRRPSTHGRIPKYPPRPELQSLSGHEHSGIPRHTDQCYPQEGEDLVAARLLGDGDNGFYVDVGAHHPIGHSNTYLFYRRGWRGIT